MNTDAVAALLRLRRMSLDEAKRTLAVRLREDTEAASRLAAAEASLVRERDIASDPATDDAAVEAFAAWLPTGRSRVEAAQNAADRAAANVTLARANLTLAHAAAESTANLLDERAAEADALAAKRAQAALDEIKPGPRPPPGD